MKSFSKLINVNDFDSWNLFFKKITGVELFCYIEKAFT
jgi:hypothetical protein